ncbi:MAG: GNAT family N-acetyltransferase [Lachnospiraceae bacterium]|nr:GNAT family N-acetyltransferase [Lachnospiraceae bacterium]
MKTDIKTIEDLSLNAWPSFQMQVYDGWILRYSAFYTHRTNCVEQIGASILPLEEKVPFCERIYDRWRTPCIFKISPITDPALDLLLDRRGYRIEHRVINMVAEINVCGVRKPPAAFIPLTIERRVSPSWIDGLFSLKGTSDPVHKKIVPGMYAAIPMDEIAVSARLPDGSAGASGLGILDRDFIGIYAIHVRESLRRRGLAEAILKTLLFEGARAGAKKAYLQVVADNAPAKALYRKTGFRSAYADWFRVGPF